MHARFYYPQHITVGRCIDLSENNHHHAIRVLRLKAGDSITLFTGEGGEYAGRIETINKSCVSVQIEAYQDHNPESPLIIELAQAVCINEKMDWIIQKAVELGVSRIQPIVTTRSVVHLSGERAAKRLQHWRKIMIAACEQCGRNQLPQIFPLLDLAEWLSRKKSQSTDETRLMLSTRTLHKLRDFQQPATDAHIVLCVGPEGGFAPEEEIIMAHTQFTPLRLGMRTFRTETASLAAIAAIQALWGDF